MWNEGKEEGAPGMFTFAITVHMGVSILARCQKLSPPGIAPWRDFSPTYLAVATDRLSSSRFLSFPASGSVGTVFVL